MNKNNKITKILQDRLDNSVIGPLIKLIDENISDVVTTFGRYIIRNIRGKLQHGITMEIGTNYSDWWIEAALYNILNRYNNLKKCTRIEMDVGGKNNGSENNRNSELVYRLESGQAHNLKYRDWNILVVVMANKTFANSTGRCSITRSYTIITSDTSTKFINAFEADMLRERDRLLKIDRSSPFVNIYQDGHEYDGYTYFYLSNKINKRKLKTVYIPNEQKIQLVNTINNFFASKDYYREHGIPHNLKILFYGASGTGKDSLVRAIASEWNRNIYYCTGGKGGKYIPNCITDSMDLINPLFLISEIDKYPFLTNEAVIDMTKEGVKYEDEQLQYKQLFANMLNALDGIQSGEDKLIIMTTNHPELFSETFMRDGRVDLAMEIKYLVPETFRRYVYDFYGKELPENIQLVSDNLSVAKLNADVVFNKMSYEDFVKKYVK